jgi:hypothetical protein
LSERSGVLAGGVLDLRAVGLGHSRGRWWASGPVISWGLTFPGSSRETTVIDINREDFVFIYKAFQDYKKGV